LVGWNESIGKLPQEQQQKINEMVDTKEMKAVGNALSDITSHCSVIVNTKGDNSADSLNNLLALNKKFTK